MPSRRSLPPALLALSLLTLAATAPRAHAESADAFKTRLHQAANESALDDPQLKPWHLKLAYQLFDAKGAQTEAGTVEEWWSSPSLYKIVYASPSYTGTQIRNADGLFYTPGGGILPSTVESILDQTIHPMPSDRDIDGATPDLRKQSFGKIPLDCIMLDQPIQGIAYPPLAFFPTYCFDPGKTSLRASFDFGTLFSVRNRTGRFQNKDVSLDLSAAINGILTYKAQVVALQTFTASDTLYISTPEMQKQGNALVGVSAGVMAGNILSKVQPIYPQRAKVYRNSGTVVLHAIIGRDGHIHSLRVISTPDPDLAMSAIAAVRQWTYKPYLFNGVPTEVDTMVTVNYKMYP
jgi:TonB family protein